MGRVIPGAVKGDFHPMVGLRKLGNYVKGKVTEVGSTTSKNPFVTLELIDLDGSTSKSVAKGQYEEVEVGQGDLVQVIGSLTDLRDKLPQVGVGDIVTITYESDIPSKKGNPKKIFKVEVE